MSVLESFRLTDPASLALAVSLNLSFCKVKCDLYLSLSLSPSCLWGAASGSVSETLRLFVAGRTDEARRGVMSRAVRE